MRASARMVAGAAAAGALVLAAGVGLAAYKLPRSTYLDLAVPTGAYEAPRPGASLGGDVCRDCHGAAFKRLLSTTSGCDTKSEHHLFGHPSYLLVGSSQKLRIYVVGVFSQERRGHP